MSPATIQSRLLLLLCCALVGSWPGHAWAQADVAKTDRPYWQTNLFKRVLTDQKFLVTEWWPNEFRRPGFTAPLVATTIAAWEDQQGGGGRAYDSRLAGRIDATLSGPSDVVAGDFTKIGNGPFVLALLGTTYWISRRAENDRLAATASLSSEALIDAGIWVTVLKQSFGRVRPNNQEEGQFFRYGSPQADSFPSGHAMGAFAVATVFAEQYHDHRWVPWVAYGTAALIAASRVGLGRHFPTDVIVGGLLGNSIGRGVVARSEEDTLSREHPRGRIVPLVDPSREGYGVAYTKTW